MMECAGILLLMGVQFRSIGKAFGSENSAAFAEAAVIAHEINLVGVGLERHARRAKKVALFAPRNQDLADGQAVRIE